MLNVERNWNDKQSEVIEAFNSTLRYLDDLLNTDLFILLEYLVMLMNLIPLINFRQQNFSKKDIDIIINFVRRFHNFIGGILP